jgi:hypothetical protein
MTVQDGGDVDRYGRNPPLIIEIGYKLPKGFRTEGSQLIYEIRMTDDEFETFLNSNNIDIFIPE